MPEIKHYDNDELNHAYVYTNIEEVHIAEDVTKDYITIYESKRRDDLNDDIDLKSIYIKRKHEKTRLNAEFRKIFSTITSKKYFINKISTDPSKFTSKIVIDAETPQLDKIQTIQGNLMIRNSEAMDLQRTFDDFALEMSKPFARVHSHGVIKRSIHKFFEDNKKITDLMDMATITLFPKNKVHFIKAIDESKSQFTRDIVEKINRETENIPKWNIPESTEYTKVYDKKTTKNV